MMMSYKVKKIDNYHTVIEVATEFVIDKFDEFNKARSFCKNLNSGYCFDGWTPEFFLKNTKKVEEEYE
jgi:hypothetical protein